MVAVVFAVPLWFFLILCSFSFIGWVLKVTTGRSRRRVIDPPTSNVSHPLPGSQRPAAKSHVGSHPPDVEPTGSHDETKQRGRSSDLDDG
jgi:hypothetical protein